MPTVVYTETEFKAVVAERDDLKARLAAVVREAGGATEPRRTINPSNWRELADRLESRRRKGIRVGTPLSLAVKYGVSENVAERALSRLSESGVTYWSGNSGMYHYR